MPAPTRKVTASAKQMCALTIGYQTLVLPADHGMQMLKLLQHAVTAEPSFEGGRYETHKIGPAPRVEFTLLQPDQLRFPADAPSTPAARRTTAINHQPTLLEG